MGQRTPLPEIGFHQVPPVGPHGLRHAGEAVSGQIHQPAVVVQGEQGAVGDGARGGAAPSRQLVTVLAAPMRDLVGVINARVEKGEEAA